MSDLKVLLISHTCQSATFGQPKARALNQMGGLDLRVIVPDRWKTYGAWSKAEVGEADRGLIQTLPVRWPRVGPAQFYLHWYPGLAKVLGEFRPDVIDLWEEPWGLVSAHACWLRNRILPEARVVCETEQNINKKLPPPFEWFRSYTLKNASYAVGRNAEAVEVLRDKGYGGPAEVVPNAVDAELFVKMDQGACRRELGLPEDAFVMGYAGRLVEEKGLDEIFTAFEGCPANTYLLLLGSGPMREKLEGRAGAAGLSERLKFVSDVPLTAVPRVMNAMDVFVLMSRTTASWKEQFGRVIIEAHACGVPVVGSSSGAIPEVVGDAGVVVPEGDAAALGQALIQMHGDPEGRARMGRIGRARVEAEFTWGRVAERMQSIYQKVMMPA